MKHFFYSFFLLFVSVSIAQSQSWKQMTSFPGGGVSGLLSFTVNDTAYIGGDGVNIYRFDPIGMKWSSFVKIPTGNRRFYGVSFGINGKGYIGMGVPSSGALYNDLWEIDLTTKKWTQKASFPLTGRDGMIAFVADGKAYIGGGADTSFVYSDFYEFDPIANTWTERAPLPMGPLVFGSTFTIKGYGCVVGGSQNGGSNFSHSLYQYDHIHDVWKQLADFPGAERQYGTAFNINGKGYYGLGGTTFGDTFNDIFEYEPATNAWMGYATLPANGRNFATAVSLVGKVYLGTGSNYSTTTLFYKDWWELDPAGVASVSQYQESNQLLLYPNPVATAFTLVGADVLHSTTMQVHDITGKTLLDFKPSLNNHYDISSLPRGEYILSLSDESKHQTIKFVKQ